MQLNKYSYLANTRYVLKKVWEYDKRLYTNAVIYAGFKMLLTATALYAPKWILEVLLGQYERSVLIRLFIIFAMAGVAGQYCHMLSAQAYSRIIELRFKLVEDHQSACLTANYETMETVEFEDKVFSSYRCVSNNTSGIEGILHRLYEWPSLLASVVVSTYALIQANIYLIIPAALSALASYYIGNRAAQKKANDKIAETSVSRKLKYIRNIFKNRSTALDVRIPRTRSLLWERYTVLRDELRSLVKRKSYMTHSAELYIALIECIKMAVIYIFLIIRTCSGAISISIFSLCIGASESFANDLGTLLKDVRFIQDQSPDISEFRDFTQEEIRVPQKPGVLIDQIEEIIFENVSYQYANSETCAVKNINVNIKKGWKIAVVGENGAGKTTFIKLLLGLYTPTSGRILVNGIDMKDINKDSLYRCIASVFQDFHMLAFSVAENISLDEDKACWERVENTLNQVGLLDRIHTLPRYLGTSVSRTIEDDGVDFSGGEVQRMALARALYTNAAWYVLDEPSAALDPLAERNMYTMFADIMRGQTMVFVSHRLASTMLCDEILFFSQGCIMERGSHEALMRLGRGYATLYETQARFYYDQRAEKEVN